MKRIFFAHSCDSGVVHLRSARAGPIRAGAEMVGGFGRAIEAGHLIALVAVGNLEESPAVFRFDSFPASSAW